MSINSKNGDSKELKRFLFDEDNDYIYIPQTNREHALLWCGMPVMETEEDNIYPLSITNKVFTDGRAKCPINVPSWLSLLQSVDFSIGTRIHGNIAAVLAGTPAYVIATDSRVLELAQYHNIPHITENEFDFSKSAKDIYAETDFTSVNKGHKERYENFADFLRVNGLNPIKNPNMYFDDRIKSIDYHEPLDNILKVPEAEVANRLNAYLPHLQRRINNQDKTVKELKKEKEERNKQISEIQSRLDSQASYIDRADQNIQKLLRENNDLIKKNTQAQKQVAALRRNITDMENSRSWKLTKPLRAIKRRLHRIFRKGREQ